MHIFCVLFFKKETPASFLHHALRPPQGLSFEAMDAYYFAYSQFLKLIRSEMPSKQIRFRLQPGDILTFNNRRMLHGRSAFQRTGPGNRHLQGTYVNIDEFKSAAEVLCREFGGIVKRVGNRDLE